MTRLAMNTLKMSIRLYSKFLHYIISKTKKNMAKYGSVR